MKCFAAFQRNLLLLLTYLHHVTSAFNPSCHGNLSCHSTYRIRVEKEVAIEEQCRYSNIWRCAEIY